MRRHIGVSAQCSLCGADVEDSFHGLIICLHARILWQEMRGEWPLPNQEKLIHTGPEWLFGILVEQPEKVRAMIIILLWRIWSLRNDLVHGKETPPAHVSRSYLASYLTSYDQAQRLNVQDIIKGKFPLIETPAAHQPIQVQATSWPKPPQGWTALSIAGTFVDESGEASAGMILRNPDGSVIFSAYRYLLYCKDVLEAEVSAILEVLSSSL